VRDEAATVVARVRDLMGVRYPALEIVVANDGSTDGSLRALIDAFGLQPARRMARAAVPRGRVLGLWASPEFPHLLVVDLFSCGRSGALNAALAHARNPLVLAVDPGTRLERDTLRELAIPFYDSPDVLAVGGVARPTDAATAAGSDPTFAGPPRGLLQRLQAIEGLREQLTDRLPWSLHDSLFILSGRLVMLSRDAALAAGGYGAGSGAEEPDLIMRLQRRAGRGGLRMAVRLAPSAVAWVEGLPSLAAVLAARSREQRALAESLWHNRELVLGTRFQLRHCFAFLSQVDRELLGPPAEILGAVLAVLLVATGGIGTPFAVLFLSIYVVGGTLGSLTALALERVSCPRYRRLGDLEKLALDALAENFLYRPLTTLARTHGLLSAASGGLATLGRRPLPAEPPAPATTAA